MNNGLKSKIAAAALMAALTAGAAYAAESVAQPEKKPRAVHTTVDNTSDSAFAADLSAAEELLRGLSHEKKMTPRQSGEYMAREMEKARKFFEFARATLVPHSMSIMKNMKNPDGLIAEGRSMVSADPSSWRGYDYLASGSLLKRDMDAALSNFEKAAASAPEFQKDWYRYMMGSCYIAKKEEGKALEYYEGVIKNNENWLAVKGAYLAAGMTLLGKDDGKAASYFDKGFLLHTPGEQAVILKTGICDKFRGLEKGPEACVSQGKM